MFNFLLIIINIIFKRKTDKEYDRNLAIRMEYEYWRNIEFKNITPVEAGILSGKDKVGANTLITILFELEKKNILNIELINNEYYVTLKCRNMSAINNLETYEKNIVKLIFNGIEDETSKSLSQIVALFSSEKELRTYLKDFYNSVRKHILKNYYKQYMLYGSNNINTFKILALIGLAIFSFKNLMTTSFYASTVWGILNIATNSTLEANILVKIIGYIIIGLMYIIPIFGIIYFVKLLKTYYVKKEYIDEVAKLRGLYNYINEFSLIKDKEIKHYELYEEYYLYAISMGLADKVEKELKLNRID